MLALAALCALAGCHRARPNMAPRPEALNFPLREAGALGFEGTLAGEVTDRYGTAWFATDEGDVYAIEIRAMRILWKFRAEAPVATSPEPGDDLVWVRDAANTIYGLDREGRPAFRTDSAGPVTTSVREHGGRIYFGCADGRIAALDIQEKGKHVWEFEAGSAVVSGPAFSDGLAIFATDDGRLLALDDGGRRKWTLSTKGAVRVTAVVSDGWLYFGTSERYFCKVRAATGKQEWAFRLAGTPLRTPVVTGRRLLFPASDSVMYCLSAGNGEILWWQSFPARVVHALVVSDGVVLVSGLSREVVGYDVGGGFRVGGYTAAGEIATGPAWASPDLLVIETDPGTGRQRMAFLVRDRRPVQTLGEKDSVKR
jgi:outer membrane protein assembly factor BamB